jgi:hypothetical protein
MHCASGNRVGAPRHCARAQGKSMEEALATAAAGSPTWRLRAQLLGGADAVSAASPPWPGQLAGRPPVERKAAAGQPAGRFSRRPVVAPAPRCPDCAHQHDLRARVPRHEPLLRAGPRWRLHRRSSDARIRGQPSSRAENHCGARTLAALITTVDAIPPPDGAASPVSSSLARQRRSKPARSIPATAYGRHQRQEWGPFAIGLFLAAGSSLVDRSYRRAAATQPLLICVRPCCQPRSR